MKILTFDLETQNHKTNKRTASPYDERNYIVQIGWSVNGGAPQEKYYTENHRDPVMPDLTDISVLVGFNIKFDLLWIWNEPGLQAFLKRGGTIYCGQYVEYLLGGMTQDVQMVSMNNIAESYGGGCKIDAVKEMWEEGILTADIPRDLLTDYLIGDGDQIVGDVTNTWMIYCGQVKRIKSEMTPEFIPMLKHRMDGLLATCEMEHNGVYVSTTVAEKYREQLVTDLAIATEELERYIPELPPELHFNWGSNTHKSCLIFGGVVKYAKWIPHLDNDGNMQYAKMTDRQPLFNGEPVHTGFCQKAGDFYVMEVPEGTAGSIPHAGKHFAVQDVYQGGKQKGYGKYKNVQVPNPDKPKGAIQDHYFRFKGYVHGERKWLGKATDAYDGPMYSTGADVIEELGKRGLGFTSALSKRTSMNKDLGTYYWTEDKNGKKKGMLTLVGDDGIIHHKLNHTSTVTSRMSASDPNVQNIPRKDKSDVKRMFVSRFGENEGRMAELDYSQLEVVIQGVLTQDKQLCQDLRDRVDFHCKRLAAKLGEDYDEVKRLCKVVEDPAYVDMRTGVKSFSFQRAYGAGASTIAEDTGMKRSDVDALIVSENLLYPSVEAFDKMLEKHIKQNAKKTMKKLFIEGIAFTQKEASWDSPTGTRYTWRQDIAPEFMQAKGIFTGFSPTQRKNYPMQGFGGEVMQTMLGKTFRYMIANDRFNGDVLMVNTVHDCQWLDGKADILDKVVPEVKALMETVPAVFNKAFPKLNIDVPFPADAEVGPDMYDLHGI